MREIKGNVKNTIYILRKYFVSEHNYRYSSYLPISLEQNQYLIISKKFNIISQVQCY
jgi:hypothetical protein